MRQVRTKSGETGSVPSTIILIPGPDPAAVQAALKYVSRVHSFIRRPHGGATLKLLSVRLTEVECIVTFMSVTDLNGPCRRGCHAYWVIRY